MSRRKQAVCKERPPTDWGKSPIPGENAYTAVLQRTDNRAVFFDERRLDLAILTVGYQVTLEKASGNGEYRAVVLLPLELLYIHGNPSP